MDKPEGTEQVVARDHRSQYQACHSTWTSLGETSEKMHPTSKASPTVLDM